MDLVTKKQLKVLVDLSQLNYRQDNHRGLIISLAASFKRARLVNTTTKVCNQLGILPRDILDQDLRAIAHKVKRLGDLEDGILADNILKGADNMQRIVENERLNRMKKLKPL